MVSRVGLTEYTAIERNGRFVPVLWVKDQSKPNTVVIAAKLIKHTAGGTYYLDWQAYERDLRRFRKQSRKSSLAQVGTQKFLALFAAGRGGGAQSKDDSLKGDCL